MLDAGGLDSPNMLFVMTVVMGIIYGFIIELFTAVVFKHSYEKD